MRKLRTVLSIAFGLMILVGGLGITPVSAQDATATPDSIYDQEVGGVPDWDTEAVGESTTIRPIPEGESRDTGLVVIRFVNNAKLTIDVRPIQLDREVTFGKEGLIAIDGWEGYASDRKAIKDACGQAIGDYKSSLKDDTWNAGYTVTFNGGPVPATCK